MIRNLFLTCLYLLLTFTTFTAVASPSILLLGDSLSASYGLQQEDGWVYILNQKKKGSYNIVNASISGETTGGGLSRLPAILAKDTFDYLIIELGGNDGLRGFPVKTIKNNLLQIIKLAKAKNIKVAMIQIKIPPNYGVRYNKMFIDVFKEISSEESIPLLPFFMETIAINPELMMPDGIHPNKKAHPLIAEIVDKDIENLIR